MEMTVVSGNQAFIIFHMTPDNIHTFGEGSVRPPKRGTGRSSKDTFIALIW